MSNLIDAFILGIVEGLTEFLPISSTGHLILAGDLLSFEHPGRDVFYVAIQTGAILAVVYYYRRKLLSVALGLASSAQARRFALNVIIAFLPAAVLGVVLVRTARAEMFTAGIR